MESLELSILEIKFRPSNTGMLVVEFLTDSAKQTGNVCCYVEVIIILGKPAVIPAHTCNGGPEIQGNVLLRFDIYSSQTSLTGKDLGLQEEDPSVLDIE